MRILVTNDDGIQSVGLKILVEWAKKLGDVTVCAPAVQQSAQSHAINIHDPIEVHKVPYMEGISAVQKPEAHAPGFFFLPTEIILKKSKNFYGKVLTNAEKGV